MELKQGLLVVDFNEYKKKKKIQMTLNGMKKLSKSMVIEIAMILFGN